MEKLCEMATVEDFWCAWNNIPKPSQIFFDGKTKKRFANRRHVLCKRRTTYWQALSTRLRFPSIAPCSACINATP